EVEAIQVLVSELELIQPEPEIPELEVEQVRASGELLEEVEPEPDDDEFPVEATQARLLIRPLIPPGIPEPEKEPAPNPDNDKFPTKAERIRTPLSWIFRLRQWKDDVLALK
ncbi:unnamed protein product, partial [marine sediment metagenome]